MNSIYAAICDEVGRVLGMPTFFEEGRSFEQFSHGAVDVGFICGLPYSKLSRIEDAPLELLVAPVLAGERYGETAVYFSDIIVHKNSPYQSFDDLQGRTFAYNEAVSYSGYHVMAHHLSQRGQDWGYFGKTVKSGAHLLSIEMIINQKADAAAIDSHALDVARAQNPALDKSIRIVDMIGPSPIPPVVVGSHLPAKLKADLRHVFLQLHKNRALKRKMWAGSIERFCEVDDAYYDLIRARVDTSKITF